LFRIEVWVDGRPLGVGEGPSRRTAETAAALQALDAIRRERVTSSAGISSADDRRSSSVAEPLP
jgi:hypothetical protein